MEMEDYTKNVFSVLTKQVPQDVSMKKQEEFLKLLEALENDQDFLKLSDYFDEAPGTTGELQFDKIEIKEDQKCGRFVQAKQDISKAQSILEIQDPLLFSLNKDKIHRFCSNCLKEACKKTERKDAVVLKSCSQCKYVFFCNQSCQREYWTLHQAECNYFKTDLQYLPQPARLLLNALYLKCYQKSKIFGENLVKFNNQICSLNTNAKKYFQKIYNTEEWDQVKSYVMMTFMCIQKYHALEVSPQNFKLILNLHFAIETNSFGIANTEQIRIGTALFFPSNFFNHSCNPNAYIKFCGKRQFVVANKAIKQGEEIFLSYINHGQPERRYRQKCIEDSYMFKCVCSRCEQQKGASTPVVYHCLEDCVEHVLEQERTSQKHEDDGEFEESLKYMKYILDIISYNKDKFSVVCEKEALERASFLNILMKKNEDAVVMQKRICEINKQIYFDQFKDPNLLPHPLLGMQLYQLSKIQSSLNQTEEATINLTQALDYLQPLLTIRSEKDSKAIDDYMINEMKENLYSIQYNKQQQKEMSDQEYEQKEIEKILEQRKKQQEK